MSEMESEGADFTLETNGNCFFCSNKLLPQAPDYEEPLSPNERFPFYSLQVLSRYLKMDRGKVFNEGGFIPPKLLVQVQKSKLQVELCEECVSINENLSKMCRQLEKIEMEVAAGLQFILDKLESTLKSSRTEEFQMMSNGEMESLGVNLGKLQVVDALRREAVQKCSRKITSLTESPRVHFQNLTLEQVTKQILKCQSQKYRYTQTSANDSEIQHFSTGDAVSDPKFEVIVMGSCSPNIDDTDHGETPEFDDYIDYSTANDEADRDAISFPGNLDSETTLGIKLETKEPCKSIALTTNFPPKLAKPLKNRYTIDRKTGKYECIDCSSGFPTPRAFHIHYWAKHLRIKQKRSVYKKKNYKQELLREKTSRNEGTKLDESYQRISIPKPVKSVRKLKKGSRGKLNPKTGRYKCSLCSSEYAADRNLWTHFQSVHLKERFQCGKCGNEFLYKRSYDEHYRSVHMGVRFKCEKCNKTYAQARFRDRHMKKVCKPAL